jgi:hypothetical protein
MDTHPTCVLIGANNGGDESTLTNLDFHHNMCAFSGNRIPMAQSLRGRWVNNIVYGFFGNSTSQFGGGSQWDIVSNHYERGQGFDRHPVQIFTDSTPPGGPSLYLSGKHWTAINKSVGRPVAARKHGLGISGIRDGNGAHVVSPLHAKRKYKVPNHGLRRR